MRDIEKKEVVKPKTVKTVATKYLMKIKKRIKSLKNKLSKIEQQIKTLEGEIKAIDVDLAVNYDEVVADPEFFDKYNAKKLSLDHLMDDWAEVTEALDNY